MEPRPDDTGATSPSTEPNPNARPEGRPSVPLPVNVEAAPAAAPFAGGLLTTAAIALVVGLGGSYGYNHFLAPRPAPAPAPAPAAPSATSAGEPGVPQADAPVTNARVLGDRIAALSNRLDRLQKSVDDMVRAGTAAEVDAMRVRIADLNTAVNSVAPLPDKVEHLTNRVGELSSSLDKARSELAAEVTRLARPAPGSGDRPTPSPTTRDVPPRGIQDARLDAAKPASASVSPAAASDDLARGAELFRQGRYREALDAFKTLESSQPDDARVWYYAALASGFLTKDWAGTPVGLVEKGVAREAAGTPDEPTIRAEFQDLSSAMGKDWLAAYRRRVRASR